MYFDDSDMSDSDSDFFVDPREAAKDAKFMAERRPGAKGLTPYQGSNRCFGKFKCSSCSRHWMSGNSWADMGQECQSCKINVYPYDQSRLKGGHNQDESTKPHPTELCEKCKKLGHSCRHGR